MVKGGSAVGMKLCPLSSAGKEGTTFAFPAFTGVDVAERSTAGIVTWSQKVGWKQGLSWVAKSFFIFRAISQEPSVAFTFDLSFLKISVWIFW